MEWEQNRSMPFGLILEPVPVPSHSETLASPLEPLSGLFATRRKRGFSLRDSRRSPSWVLSASAAGHQDAGEQLNRSEVAATAGGRGTT